MTAPASRSSDQTSRGQDSLCQASPGVPRPGPRLLLTHLLLPWGALGRSSSCWGPWGPWLTSAVSNRPPCASFLLVLRERTVLCEPLFLWLGKPRCDVGRGPSTRLPLGLSQQLGLGGGWAGPQHSAHVLG